MPITLQQARDIADIAYAEGAKRGLINMAVVVTDPGGHVRLAMRADGQGIFGVETATSKCTAALGFNRSSLLLSRTFDNPCAVAGLQGAVHGKFLPLGGAVVVTDADGNIQGAAGVSGGMPDVDDEIIRIAVTGIGLAALD